MPLLLMHGVHITVSMELLVYVLCQPVHSCIELSLHLLDFFKKPFYGDLFLFFFDKTIVTCAAHTLAVDVSFLHICTDEWFPCKKCKW